MNSGRWIPAVCASCGGKSFLRNPLWFTLTVSVLDTALGVVALIALFINVWLFIGTIVIAYAVGVSGYFFLWGASADTI